MSERGVDEVDAERAVARLGGVAGAGGEGKGLERTRVGGGDAVEDEKEEVVVDGGGGWGKAAAAMGCGVLDPAGWLAC
jgi:hypothetical protein